MEDNKIIVTTKEGEKKEAELLLYFTLVEGGPKYMIYTFNEKDSNDLVKIYSSLVKETENGITLENIESDEEWTQVKEMMRKVISENKE
jgi:uncharacterized protein YrzB (UPF0473 family)